VARPLNKCKTDGSVYTRPLEIEAAIDEALALDVETRLSGAEILDRQVPGFLPKEALVYLIRDARRVDDQTTVAKLFTILARRCEAILVRQVPNYPHAQDIRAETLLQLVELVATDETGTDPHRLDFFEVRFDLALLRLWKTIERTYLRRRKHEIVAAGPDNQAEDALEVDAEQEPMV
jgi:hypothetical protein